MTIAQAKRLTVGDIVSSSYLDGFDDPLENFGEVIEITSGYFVVNWVDGIVGTIEFSELSAADILRFISLVK